MADAGEEGIAAWVSSALLTLIFLLILFRVFQGYIYGPGS